MRSGGPCSWRRGTRSPTPSDAGWRSRSIELARYAPNTLGTGGVAIQPATLSPTEDWPCGPVRRPRYGSPGPHRCSFSCPLSSEPPEPTPRTALDEGSFRLLIDGREVGRETFSIRRAGSGPDAAIIAQGRVSLDAGPAPEEVATKLEVSGVGLRPTAYELTVRGEESRRILGRVVGGRVSARIISPAARRCASTSRATARFWWTRASPTTTISSPADWKPLRSACRCSCRDSAARCPRKFPSRASSR